jgi:hypothetical protein
MNTHDLLADAMRLQVAIEDTQGLLDAIEGARQQLSVLGDELKGKITIAQERQYWLSDLARNLVQQVKAI